MQMAEGTLETGTGECVVTRVPPLGDTVQRAGQFRAGDLKLGDEPHNIRVFGPRNVKFVHAIPELQGTL